MQKSHIQDENILLPTKKG